MANANSNLNGQGNGTAQVNKRRPVVDDALEREIELEALRKENEELRTLLGISGIGVGLEEGQGLGLGLGHGQGLGGATLNGIGPSSASEGGEMQVKGGVFGERGGGS